MRHGHVLRPYSLSSQTRPERRKELSRGDGRGKPAYTSGRRGIDAVRPCSKPAVHFPPGRRTNSPSSACNWQQGAATSVMGNQCSEAGISPRTNTLYQCSFPLNMKGNIASRLQFEDVQVLRHLGQQAPAMFCIAAASQACLRLQPPSEYPGQFLSSILQALSNPPCVIRASEIEACKSLHELRPFSLLCYPARCP